jgi:hypothetical protein
MEAVFEIILLFTLAKFTILKIQYIEETILMVHFRGTYMHVIVIENAFEIEQSKGNSDGETTDQSFTHQ